MPIRECTHCAGTNLAWLTWPVVERNGINGQVGHTEFYLGCEECGETLISSVRADVIADALTRLDWRPDAE